MDLSACNAQAGGWSGYEKPAATFQQTPIIRHQGYVYLKKSEKAAEKISYAQFSDKTAPGK
jgi:hypothetical protein